MAKKQQKSGRKSRNPGGKQTGNSSKKSAPSTSRTHAVGKTGSATHKIQPLGSRILIRPFSKEELAPKTSFGIILPEKNDKEKSEQGIVLAVGPGSLVDGRLVPVSVKVGDTVAFSKYGYDDITVDGEEVYLIKEENVLAVINR